MLYPAAIVPKIRKHLSFDPLIRQIHQSTKQLPDARVEAGCSYSVTDAVMSAIALFSLKDPSLLAFQERRSDANMKNIFCISQVPSDTQMREILDSQTLQLGHRSNNHSGQRISFSPWRSFALEDRKRNVQYAQESGLPVRTQLWAWPAESVEELSDVDYVGLLGRPNAGTLLSFVPGHSQDTPYSC